MLDSLFRPRSVAVIGASAKELSIGNRIIKNLVDFGFKGPIYPINPKADEVRGIRAYGSILDVPGDTVDVVHMVIPARFVPQAIADCGQKGVKFVILNGGGFAEVGPEGAAIEQDCMDRARENGIRILGPNCQGIINTDPEVRAYCNFTFTRPDPGAISIVALSGGVAEVIHQAFSEMGVGTRMYASNGNACDVSIPEIIEYYGEDEGTRVIVLYVEGLRESKTFLEVTKRVAAKKPILAMKAGRTEVGAKAAASHTGGLARVDMSADLIFEKAGILNFMDEAELCQAAVAFASQPIPRGNRVGMITNTGGPAVISTDIFANAGLEIPPLSERAKATLEAVLFPEAAIQNPVDVLATAGATHFRAALDVMMDEDQVDSVYINMVTPFFVDTESIAREIVEVNQASKKPIVCNLMTDKRQWTGTLRLLMDGGVPCYGFPGTAARALVALARYNDIRCRELGEVKRFDDVDRDRAAGILQKTQAAGREFLTAAESYEILAAYGIPAADWRIANNAAEAESAAAEIGFPVVVKAESESILHKSDVGGVALGLRDGAAVRAAVERMEARLDAPDLRFLVQKHLPGGLEVIVGAKAEDELGHLVMFGIGGIYVEVLKDVAFKIAPVTAVEAREMLSAITMAPLLEGVRGAKGIDQQGIIEVIQRVSQLVTDLPAIQEMDLNPLIAYEDGVFVVDARVALIRSQ
ncbi:MAG: acetate--CoA ligase family protein [Chloroflexi bacterium]|nr:acetate--CoA ligase family protein [Chloroflexota bacterium]MBU1747688.1 acetate--CoA ligase family protein [Chloroflexota bacterium]MBU1879005.1 acetate--CoA ligase family protein [Chloroflexota bacterium]